MTTQVRSNSDPPMPPPQKPHGGRLSNMIKAAMSEKNMTIRGLHAALDDITYEHTRRVVQGECSPSKYVLREICRILGLDLGDADMAMKRDKVERKYGDVFVTTGAEPMTGHITAHASPVDEHWADLTPDQREDLARMASDWARRNRRSRQ